ncbi:MAG: hypothetical protein GX089_03680 [Fibrobacter sp.]|jgi:hypothetical protein|nr:hypothetical protein [Fibrobacter sp.]
MYLNRFTDVILDRLPRQKWNSLSRFISSLTIPCIGSPIRFRTRGFTLREYDLESTPGVIIEQYFKFCYPPDEIRNPEEEFEIDKQYLPSAQTFIVTRDSDQKIVGCLQLVYRSEKVKLPVEFARIFKNESGRCESSNVLDSLPAGKKTEFYRCRKGKDLTGAESAIVVPMLFKAGFIKTIQEKVDYCLLSYYKENSMLRNLYTRKLAFKPSGISIKYARCDKEWELLLLPTTFVYNDFASVSKTHFYLMTYFRSNLKINEQVISNYPKKQTQKSSVLILDSVVEIKKRNNSVKSKNEVKV